MEDNRISSYREWRQVAFQLSADLRTGEEIASRCGLITQAAMARALRERTESRRFTVAVVGDFKRGKSTFINALLGRAILPADVLPTTATINRVTYGLRSGVEVVYRDGRPPQTVQLGELAAFVTKLSETSRDVASTVKEAVIRYPLHFCKNDVDLVDTPGLGDEAVMTQVTMSLLPEVDLAIFVILATSPFSASEGAFLRQLLDSGVSRVVYVVGAIDRLRNPSDATRVLEDVRRRVERQVHELADSRHPPGSREHRAFLQRHGTAVVYGVSALDALEARLERDPARLERSGMPAFETALEQTLTASDAMGLEHLLTQLHAFGGELARARFAADGPLSRDAIERELDRLETLLQVAGEAGAAHERRLLDTAVAVRSSMDVVFSNWIESARRKLHDQVGAASLPPDWQAIYHVFARDLAGVLSSWSEDELDPLIEALDTRVSVELAAIVADTRPEGVTRAVVAYVDGRARELGDTSTSTLLGAADAASPFLWTSMRTLGLPSEDLLACLLDAKLVEPMKAYLRRTGFDRLLSLDFGGETGQWALLAQAQVSAVAERLWTLERLRMAVAADLEVIVQSARTSAAGRLEVVHRTQRRLVGIRERYVAEAEQTEKLRERDLATIDGIRQRALGAKQTMRDLIDERIGASMATAPATGDGRPSSAGA